VSKEKEGKIVDARCHGLTASYIRSKHQKDENVPVCDLFESFDIKGKEFPLPPGIYNLSDLKRYGQAKGWCPYFVARHAVSLVLSIVMIK